MGVKISQLMPPPRRVELGDGSFEVRGLTLQEIVNVLVVYQGAFLPFLSPTQQPTDEKKVNGSDPASEPANFSLLIATSPLMVRDIICLAAGIDDDEEIKAVERLTAEVQLLALKEIWELTVPNPKKLHDLVLAVGEVFKGMNQNPALQAAVKETMSRSQKASGSGVNLQTPSRPS